MPIDYAKQAADIAKMVDMAEDYPDDVWRSMMCQVMRKTMKLPGGENLGVYLDRTAMVESDQCKTMRDEADRAIMDGDAV